MVGCSKACRCSTEDRGLDENEFVPTVIPDQISVYNQGVLEANQCITEQLLDIINSKLPEDLRASGYRYVLVKL